MGNGFAELNSVLGNLEDRNSSGDDPIHRQQFTWCRRLPFTLPSACLEWGCFETT